MRNYATADCETDPFLFGRVPKPFLWGFYDGDKFLRFFDTRGFVDHISLFKGIVYMHNGGKFDVHFLADFIKPETDVLIINGRVASIRIGECEIRDSFLLLPVALKAYKKDDIDYSKMEKDVRAQHIPEITDYMKGDCVYLYEILSVQFDQFGQKLTLAGSAFAYWQKFYNAGKMTPRSSIHFFKHFQPFYYGGRVECFRKGIINEKFSVFDINSAYPYAMLHEHASGTEYKRLSTIPDDPENCFIRLRGVSRGALPYRDDKGLSFPNDAQVREYACTGWEVKKALELGCLKIRSVSYCAKFLQTITFKDYVEYFYLRKEASRGKDEAKYLLCKLYLNSLYGKFGQSSEDHREFLIDEFKRVVDYEGEGYSFDGNIGKLALLSKPIDENKHRFYNVCTAASVTGFVRAFLFEHIHKSEGVMYCDTDSLIVKNFNGKIGSALGEWKHEGNFTDGAIGGKKMYALHQDNNKYKISSKGARLTHKEIYQVASGKPVLYKRDSPSFGFGRDPFFVERTIKMT